MAGGLLHANGLINVATLTDGSDLIRIPLGEREIAVVRTVHWGFPTFAQLLAASGAFTAMLSHNHTPPPAAAGFFALPTTWSTFTYVNDALGASGGYGLVATYDQPYPGDGYWIAGDQLLMARNLMVETVSAEAVIWYEKKTIALGDKLALISRTVIQTERENR